MAIFTSIGFGVLNQSVQRLDAVVNNNNSKTELLNHMRTVARERNINLQKMVNESSEELIEQLWAEMSQYGGEFVEAREILMAMALTPQERAFLQQQAEQSRIIAPLQHQIAELIVFNDRDKARKLLAEKALPLQDKIFDVLSDLLSIQKQTAAMALEDAEEDYHRAMIIMAVVAIIIFFISINIIVYIIKRITRTEETLLFHKNNLEALVDARTEELEGALRLAELANKTKSEFVSTVSHELRTPLTSIRASIGLIKGGTVGDLPDNMQMMLDIAESNTERLIYLINDLLDIQKIEAGQMAFNCKDTKLKELLQQAVEHNQAYAVQNSISLNLEFVDGVDTVYTDPDRLLQVIDNVLSNAIKFSGTDGEVEVEVKDQANSLSIAIIDHGEGIPLAFQDKIFDKFTQADASDTRKYGGTGLGMNISRAIMEELKGTISFTSSSQGTTFWIEVPKYKILTK